MIIYRQGDAVKALETEEINTLAHGCNCFSTMGSGIAKQISTIWPLVATKDKQLSITPTERLGQVIAVPVDKGKTVLNCYTQFNYGRNRVKFVDYNAIRNCMKRINVIQIPDMILGMPKIGAGLGGGNWHIIERIINQELQIPVYIYIV